jgi:hypothetical protein
VLGSLAHCAAGGQAWFVHGPKFCPLEPRNRAHLS